MPSSEGQANYDCGEFHMSRLRADLGSVVEGEEDGAVLLPGGALGTMAIPALPVRLVGSRCSWKTLRKLLPSYSHPPSTYMVYWVGRGMSCGSVSWGLGGGCVHVLC